MRKHCLTLALVALLGLTSAARQPRSIWPWSSSAPAQEPLIPEKHAEILRQAGYGDYLDLSKHPVWKIHKYEGIDLKPVQVEAEIIKPAPQQQASQLPELDARNPASSGAAPVSESAGEQSPPPDLSFLDNLGGLAYFLPGPEDEEDAAETEKANILAGAIASEEHSHPGFFSKLWSTLWGAEASRNSLASAENVEDDSALLQIALPATKENYAEISLVQPTSTRLAQLAVQPAANQAHQYAFTAGAEQAVKPVAKWYRPTSDQFSRSQAWIQSWNPNAAYNVHVEGPAEYPAAHVATVQAYTADPNNHFQRKVSRDEEVAFDDKSALANEEEKTAQAQDDSQQIISKDGEKATDNHSELSVSENQKEETTANDDSPKIVSASEKEEASGLNANVSEDVQKKEEAEKVVVVVAEGQGQEVAEELESASAAESKRDVSLRQKAVNVLKMNVVPQRFLRQLQISDQEIDDFVNNRESSNKTWNKIRVHLHKLGPLSGARGRFSV